MRSVVTYWSAYPPYRKISLCDKHAADTPSGVPSLGTVEHGAHEGACDACDVLEEPKKEAAMANYGICDGDSNLITMGLDYRNVWETARRLATERGESVYVFEQRLPGADDDDNDDARYEEQTEVAPA